jgi:chorismate-pyruvate lyase
VLLRTDGTVTHLVEMYAEEPMVVIKLEQSLRPLHEESVDLQLVEPETVLRRKVLLQGSRSGKNFLYAESVIMADRLPPSVRDTLVHTDEPIGRVLNRSRMETFREILRWWQEPAASCADHFDVDAGTVTISRSYRLWAGQRPIMLITEKFPSTSFVTP